MSQNTTLLTPKKRAREQRQEQAARLLGRDQRTDEQIAALVGVCRRTLARWKQLPAVREGIRRERKEFCDQIDRDHEAALNRLLLTMSDRDLIRAMKRAARQSSACRVRTNRPCENVHVIRSGK